MCTCCVCRPSVWRSGHLEESFVTFYLYMAHGDQTQVARLDQNMLPIKHSPCLLHSNTVVGNSLSQREPVWPIISITHEDISHELLFFQINAIEYARRLYSSA